MFLEEERLEATTCHLVGIKGTGMCALAQWLQSKHVKISGSDTAEYFYTNDILTRWKIPFFEQFKASQVPADCQVLIHSAAYDESNIEIQTAQARGLKIYTYPKALGAISKRYEEAVAVAGVHGKTTSTLLIASLVKALALATSVWSGGAAKNIGNSAIWLPELKTAHTREAFVAETCEYRSHFEHFSPKTIVLTSIEWDHQDHFKTEAAIFRSFLKFIRKLPKNGRLIYCADDPGVMRVLSEIRQERQDIRYIDYGFQASSEFKISKIVEAQGQTKLLLASGLEFALEVPGRHLALNSCAALAVVKLLYELSGARRAWGTAEWQQCQAGFSSFTGASRRSELIGRPKGITIVDDYAHHPTAIALSLAGFKKFYPNKRLIVDFMSHTYSRTNALLADFGSCFALADELILHRIYSSARELDESGATERNLLEKIKEHVAKVHYFPEVLEALPYCLKNLRAGDLFVTMGAGNNFLLAQQLYQKLQNTS